MANEETDVDSEATVYLLACPFCGGHPWVKDLAGFEIGCNKCGALGPNPLDGSRDKAIAGWNKRST